MSRNHSIDTLRTIACILVIAIHVTASQIHKENPIPENFAISFIINTFSRIAVPLFIMITGRFLFLQDHSYKSFYRKRLKRILLPLLFWILIYVFTYIGFNTIANEPIQLEHIIKSILLGNPYYHLWYLYMLIGLYLITPVLNNAFKGFSKATLTKVGFALITVSMINQTYNFIYDIKPFFVLWSFNYVGYFILGYAMKDKKYLSNVWLVLIFISCFLINNFLSLKIFHQYNTLPLFNYLSPFVIIGSLAIYSLFSNFNLKSNILSRAANLSFGIYLIHPLIIKLLYLFLEKDFILKELAVIALAYLISIFIVFLFTKNKFLIKVV